MNAKEQRALERAQHELTTLNGLYAFDGADPMKHFRIDTKKAIREIDGVIGKRKRMWIKP